MIKLRTRTRAVYLVASIFTLALVFKYSWERYQDRNLEWLEELDSSSATRWVTDEKARIKSSLLDSPLAKENERIAQAILQKNKKFSDGLVPNNSNENLLDLTTLNKSERKKYQLIKMDCLKTNLKRCLLYLSEPGSFDVDIREFDFLTKNFVSQGFRRITNKGNSDYTWIDSDTILSEAVARNGFIESAYHPDTPLIWKRSEAIQKTDKSLSSAQASLKRLMSSYSGKQPLRIVFNPRPQSGIMQQGILIGTKELKAWLLPTDYKVVAYLKNKLILFRGSNRESPYNGDVFEIDVQSLEMQKPIVKRIFENAASEFVNEVSIADNSVYLNLSRDLNNRIVRLSLRKDLADSWRISALASPTSGTVKFLDEDSNAKILRFTHEDSLRPRSIYAYNESLDLITTIASSSPDFDGSALKVEERIAVSRDGTKIPYFLIANKAMRTDGNTPTVILGYGANGVALPNVYRSVTGKLWLEKGGAFAFAYGRGGGGFGRKWHEDGKREKKQNSIDDFIAVAEDLISLGVTSPSHLGIKGANNGGLLVGAVLVQRPDLFKAVFCESPYLDMMRFKTLNGTERVREYGDPDVAEDAKFLKLYSPLHNLSASQIYPDVLFMTSHSDDRVHPAHARKMAERLKELEQRYLYFEATDGEDYDGFEGWLAKSNSLAMTFFTEKLGPFPLK
ncbi:MAG: S9 family peptidase [Proteobacteria bacterium]|nr:MAG: S9 family peptidase [Pseudomonadota bacterium]